jgi:PAS domain S-box-containing protein
MRISGIPRQPRSLAFHALLAGGTASGAFLINIVFLELTDVGSIPLFLAAVVICAWFAGPFSAVLCMLFSFPMVMMISPPRWELSIDNGDDWIRIALLGAVSLMVITLDRMRRGAERLEHDSQVALLENEERLRLAMAAGGMGTFEWDIPKQRIHWSAEIEALRGVSSGQDFDGSLLDFLAMVHEDDREPLQLAVTRTLAASAPDLDVEYRARSLDGEVHWFAAKGRVIRSADGLPVRISGVAWDTTARKTSEIVLRESEERFRAMANTAPVLIWLAGPDNLGTWFNRPWLDFTGRALEQELGVGWTETIHPDDLERAGGTCQEAFDKREEFRMEFRMRRRDGEYRWVLDHGVPRYGAEGEFLGYIGSCIDVHERKQAEERDRFLAEASAVLASSLDYEETLSALVNTIVPRIADFCVVDLKQPDGNLIRAATAAADAAKKALLEDIVRRYPSRETMRPIHEALSSGKSYLFREVDQSLLARGAQDEEHARIQEKLNARSTIVVPLLTRGEAVGVLTLNMSESGRLFSEDQLSLAEALAQRAAYAIENSRLFVRSQETQARQQFLVDAGASLAASLELDETMQKVARLPVPELGDFCVVQLRDAERTVGRVVYFAADSQTGKHLAEFQEKFPEAATPGSLREMAMSQRKTQFVPEVDDAMLQGLAQNDAQLGLLRGMGVRGAIAVPLIAHGEVTGALTLAVTVASGRRYSAADVLIAEGFAQRAALAIENARLFHESQETQEKLRKANAVKDEFLGMVSHELRTPVTTMYSGARLLLARFDELDDDVKRDVIRDVENESERLQLIIENLLALARQEEGHKMQPEPVSVKRAVDTALRRVSKQRPARRMEWESGEQPNYVSCVPIYLDLILRNVIDNADKYSPPDRPIEVRTESQNGVVLIKVRDHGPGVPEAEAEKIFDRFYRAAQTSKGTSGAGIGLAVCRRLAETQGGTIDMRNADGGGLEITVCLPAYKQN